MFTSYTSVESRKPVEPEISLPRDKALLYYAACRYLAQPEVVVAMIRDAKGEAHPESTLEALNIRTTRLRANQPNPFVTIDIQGVSESEVTGYPSPCMESVRGAPRPQRGDFNFFSESRFQKAMTAWHEDQERLKQEYRDSAKPEPFKEVYYGTVLVSVLDHPLPSISHFIEYWARTRDHLKLTHMTKPKESWPAWAVDMFPDLEPSKKIRVRNLPSSFVALTPGTAITQGEAEGLKENDIHLYRLDEDFKAYLAKTKMDFKVPEVPYKAR